MILGILGFTIGAILGSFIKALADRSLNDRSFWGRSYCPHCQHFLQWYDLFPIISYLLLKGKCRYCHKSIGLEYLVVEVIMGMVMGFLFWQSFANFQFSIFNFQSIFNIQYLLFFLALIYRIFFISVLAMLFLTDIKRMLIPDRIVIPAILISAVYLITTTSLKIGYLYYSLSQTELGRLLLPPQSNYFSRHALITAEDVLGAFLMALAIGGLFLFLSQITAGRGMGGGDVKLGFLMGLGLGFPYSLVALMVAFLSGAMVAIILVVLGKKHFGQTIPFGPFLVIGSIVALFWGSWILEWYLKLSI